MWHQLTEQGSKRQMVGLLRILADVFVPDGGIFLDVIGEERDAFLRIQVDDFDAQRAKPVHAALESAAFADDHASKTELAD
jgi:hypothetical protein